MLYQKLIKLLNEKKFFEIEEIYQNNKTSIDKNEDLLAIYGTALFNQNNLIAMRTEKGVDKLLPGITGWAQVNGRDELSIPEKVKFDEEYLKKISWKMDIYIIWLTFIKVIKKDSVTH